MAYFQAVWLGLTDIRQLCFALFPAFIRCVLTRGTLATIRRRDS